MLTALFRDVAGHVRWIGTTADSMLATPPVSKSQAEGLADRLISLRKGASLRTYHQLATVIRSFQDDLALTDGQIAALLANLDPSTRLNQFNADSARAAGMSKADLTRASTELCFGASGYFEIESMGILTAGGGTTVGLGWSSVVVRIADVIRHATQSEFTSGRIGGVNTTTHPNAAIDAASSTIDGQVSMFVPPPVIPAFTHANYCISITSAVGKLPTNHIVQYIPDAHILTVMETVDNDKGWGVEYEDHEPKTGMRGFKFTPGVLGGKKKVEKVRYCFSVPDGALDVLKVITKAGSPSHIIEFPIDPPPLPGTSKYDPDGFKVTFEGYYLHTEDGSSTSHGLPDRFYATYYRGFDAVLGWHKTATTTRTKGTRALGGSSLMPDGTLSRRAIPAQLSYKATDNLHKLQGTLEFWVKLADDGGAGAFEPLIYAVNPIAETETQALITRIVRHGTSLIATRGYVGTPTAAAGPYPLSMTESIADVASWRKHEWHHVAIVWFDGTDHRFYVDGVLAAERTTATAPMLLIDNDATDRMCVGGYTYGAGIERYSTSTISELKIYSLLEYTGPSFEPSARFVADDSTTACHWSGRLHLPYTEGARVAAISWIERRPDGWATQEYDDAATPDVEVSYRLGSSLVWIDLPKADASGGDGRGVDLSLDLAPGAASTFVYRFRFTCSVEPFNAAPAIDELRIIVVGPPRYLLLRTR